MYAAADTVTAFSPSTLGRVPRANGGMDSGLVAIDATDSGRAGGYHHLPTVSLDSTTASGSSLRCNHHPLGATDGARASIDVITTGRQSEAEIIAPLGSNESHHALTSPALSKSTCNTATGAGSGPRAVDFNNDSADGYALPGDGGLPLRPRSFSNSANCGTGSGITRLIDLTSRATPQLLSTHVPWDTEVVRATHSQLSTIPPIFFFQSRHSHLQILDLSHNNLNELPEAVARLYHLRRLHLQDNQLSRLPDALSTLRYLEVLTVSKNRIEALGDFVGRLERLEVLDVSDNKLTTVPTSLGFLAHTLAVLLVNGNPFDKETAQLLRPIITKSAKQNNTIFRKLWRRRYTIDKHMPTAFAGASHRQLASPTPDAGHRPSSSDDRPRIGTRISVGSHSLDLPVFTGTPPATDQRALAGDVKDAAWLADQQRYHSPAEIFAVDNLPPVPLSRTLTQADCTPENLLAMGEIEVIDSSGSSRSRRRPALRIEVLPRDSQGSGATEDSGDRASACSSMPSPITAAASMVASSNSSGRLPNPSLRSPSHRRHRDSNASTNTNNSNSTSSGYSSQLPRPPQHQRPELAAILYTLRDMWDCSPQHTEEDQVTLLMRYASNNRIMDERDVQRIDITEHVRKAKCNPERRQRAVQEIIMSEYNYTGTLRDLIECYLVPMRKKGIVDEHELGILFGNVETIYAFHANHFHQALLESVKGRSSRSAESQHLTAGADDTRIGQVFIKFGPILRLYSNYANNYPLATQLLRKLETKREYSRFLKTIDLSQYSNKRTSDLRSKLAAPIQRIPNYLLFLRNLLGVTPTQHPDHADLCQALKVVMLQGRVVNERKRDHEYRQQLYTIQSEIKGAHTIPLVAPNRRFTRSAKFRLHIFIEPQHRGEGDGPSLSRKWSASLTTRKLPEERCPTGVAPQLPPSNGCRDEDDEGEDRTQHSQYTSSPKVRRFEPDVVYHYYLFSDMIVECTAVMDGDITLKRTYRLTNRVLAASLTPNRCLRVVHENGVIYLQGGAMDMVNWMNDINRRLYS